MQAGWVKIVMIHALMAPSLPQIVDIACVILATPDEAVTAYVLVMVSVPVKRSASVTVVTVEINVKLQAVLEKNTTVHFMALVIVSPIYVLAYQVSGQCLCSYVYYCDGLRL